jgi:hypothetical protein
MANESLDRQFNVSTRFIFLDSEPSSSAGVEVHDELGPLLSQLAIVSCFRPAAIVTNFSTIKAFYGLGLSVPRQTPNLKDQGIPFYLDHHL